MLQFLVPVVLAALVFFGHPTTLPGQEVTKVATTIGTFLKLDVGPKAAALGGSYVALANDATTMAWNPAGMPAVERRSLAASYAQLYAGISHYYFGLILPLDPSDFLGLSVIYLNSGEMEVTTPEFDRGLDEYFTVSDMALGVSYSRRMTDFLNLGITVKWIREQIYREVAQTIAFDVGSYFNTGVMATVLGMSITNFGPEMKLDGPDLDIDADIDEGNQGNRVTPSSLKTEQWPLPLTFRMGIRSDLLGGLNTSRPSRSSRLSFFADASDPLDHTVRMSFGVEYEWQNILAVRMGRKVNGWKRYTLAEYQEDDSKNPYVEYPIVDENGDFSLEGFAFGIGLHLSSIQVDYAVTNYGLLDFVHQFALQVQF